MFIRLLGTHAAHGAKLRRPKQSRVMAGWYWEAVDIRFEQCSKLQLVDFESTSWGCENRCTTMNSYFQISGIFKWYNMIQLIKDEFLDGWLMSSGTETLPFCYLRIQSGESPKGSMGHGPFLGSLSDWTSPVTTFVDQKKSQEYPRIIGYWKTPPLKTLTPPVGICFSILLQEGPACGLARLAWLPEGSQRLGQDTMQCYYIYITLCIYIYIHIRVYITVYIYISIYIHIHNYTHLYIYMYVCVWLHVALHSHGWMDWWMDNLPIHLESFRSNMFFMRDIVLSCKLTYIYNYN